MKKSTYDIYKNVLSRYEKNRIKKKKMAKSLTTIVACFVFVFSVSLSIGFMVFRNNAFNGAYMDTTASMTPTTQGQTVSKSALEEKSENTNAVASKPYGTGSEAIETTSLAEINELNKTLIFSEGFFFEAIFQKFVKSDNSVCYSIGGESQDFNYMIMVSKNGDDFTENFLTESTVYNDCQVLYSSDFLNYKIASGDWFIQINLSVVKNIPSSEIFVLDKMFKN